jgi:gas vesicle protein
MKDSGFGSFLAGVVIGGLIGAAIGMLLAPASGDKLRNQVGEYVDEKRAAFGEAVNEGRAAADQARAEMGTGDAEANLAEGSTAPEGAA